jgi:hypothetical protein
MRRLARGYSIHLRSRAALIRRNDDFGIGTHGKAYLFGPFVRCEHFLHESCRRADADAVAICREDQRREVRHGKGGGCNRPRQIGL